MKKVASIFLFLISALCAQLRGQDPQFTQFFSNPLHLAPSFAGATEASRITSMYRSQWAGVSDAFVTYSFSYDHYFDQFNSGFGVLFLKDAAGSARLGVTSIGLQYSYDFQIFNTWHVRPGIHFNYLQEGIEYDKLIYITQIVRSSDGYKPSPPAKEKAGDVDFSGSLLIYSRKLWLGGGVEHLLDPDVSLYKSKNPGIPYKISLFGGFDIVKKGHLLKPMDEKLTFSALYRKQDEFNQLDFGMYWYKQPIVAGIWLRGIPKVYGGEEEKRLLQVGDAVALLVGYKVRQISLVYSYDFTISRLVTSTNGSHEVSMTFNFKHERKKKITSIPCPVF